MVAERDSRIVFELSDIARKQSESAFVSEFACKILGGNRP